MRELKDYVFMFVLMFVALFFPFEACLLLFGAMAKEVFEHKQVGCDTQHEVVKYM